MQVTMDSNFQGLNLWLLRGIPKRCKESEVVDTLSQLGEPPPDFWYLPGIRKPNLQNRGYAFLGYSCTRDVEALRLVQRLTMGSFAWPLQLERSTSPVNNMENNARIWAARCVMQEVPDRGGAFPRASWPHHPQTNERKVRHREASQQDINLSTHAPPYSTEVSAATEAWQLPIQEMQAMPILTLGTSSTSSGTPYVAEAGDFGCYGLYHDRIQVIGDKKFPVIAGLPVFL